MRIFLSAIRWVIFAATMLGFTGLALAQETAAAPTQSKCMMCHKDAAESLTHSKHGVKTDMRTPAGSNQNCEACHTNAADHQKSPKSSKPLMFNKTVDAHARSEPCIACHQNTKTHMNWVGSEHERSDVSCNDCHKVHEKTDQVMVPETQAGVCFDCHKDVRAASMRSSTHPIVSGSMPCTSCHQPHGSAGDADLIKATVNETCYTCHADKRGPLLWDHPPVSENCMNCHNPHGSNNRPMLTMRSPFLCQQCHTTGHGGDARFVAQGCANCHSQVHGSNHPAGARLTR